MKKNALIIDTRQNYMVIMSIRNAMKHLSHDEWDFCIYTTNENFKNFYSKIFKNLYNIYNDVNIDFDIRSEDDYNKFMTSLDLWRVLEEKYDKTLIYQHDSWILNSDINEFLEYDYVGGPWWDRWYGGNGGLSIRSPKIMRKILEHFNPTTFQNRVHEKFMEDVYFSNLTDFFGKMAPREVNQKFSLECCYFENTFGIHKWHLTNLNSDEVVKILNQEKNSDIEKIYLSKCWNKSDINEHLPILREYASRCESVVEMGVRDFVSTYALAMGEVKKLTSIDIEYSKNFESFKEQIKSTNTNFEYVVDDVFNVKIEETDLLFIDTLHQYSQLKKELEMFSDKVKKYIILHDTTTYSENGEEIQHVPEIMVKNYVKGDKGLQLQLMSF